MGTFSIIVYEIGSKEVCAMEILHNIEKYSTVKIVISSVVYEFPKISGSAFSESSLTSLSTFIGFLS